MVLVTSFSAMPNSRPGIVLSQQRSGNRGEFLTYGVDTPVPDRGRSLHVPSLTGYQPALDKSRNTPQDLSQNKSQDAVRKLSSSSLKSSSLVNFSQPSSNMTSPLSSSSASSLFHSGNNRVMVNGFLVDLKPPLDVKPAIDQRTRRVGQHRLNGHINHQTTEWTSSLSRVPKSASCTQISHDLSSLNDMNDFTSGRHRPFPNDRPKTEFKKSGILRINATKIPEVVPKNGPSNGLVKSPSIDQANGRLSPYPVVDKWSPSYVKLSFLMGNGNSDSRRATNSGSTETTGQSSLAAHAQLEIDDDYKQRSNFGRERLDLSYKSRSMQCLNEQGDKTPGNYVNPGTVRLVSAHHSDQSSTGSSDLVDFNRSYGTYSRRGSDQQLRRTVSYEPQGFEPAPVINRTSSDGEIESEYVLLDPRYVPSLPSRLGRVDEFMVKPSDFCLYHFSPNSSISSNGSSKENHHVTHHDAPANLDPLHAPVLIRPSASMYSVKPNPNHVDPRMPHKKRLNLVTLDTVSETSSAQFYSPRSSTSSSRETGSPRSISSLTHTPLNFTPAPSRRSGRGPSKNTSDLSQQMTRSRSLPDLQAEAEADKEMSSNYSDDEDGDDFGFLSYPISFSSCSPAMHKVKPSSPGARIFPKRWRSKTKAIPSLTPTAMWTPGPPGSCTWSSVSGRKVQLRPSSILSLCEAERQVLQTIALSKLQAMEMGCPITLPKENDDLRKTKKSSLSLKRRSKSVSAPALDAMCKDGQGLVFGIPLNRCLMNDREVEKRRRKAAASGSSSSMKMRTDSGENLALPRSARKSSSSSQGSLENSSSLVSHHHDLAVPSHKRAASSDSLSESESSRNTSSSLIDALSLSTSNPASRPGSLAIDGAQLANQGEPQVPYVVKECFRHIETYGLQTLGIFRVGCSKKRVKQLREEFDSGREVHLTDEYNPHDVGALLKEYFRDLPDPLLTRELYLPFLYAKRLKDEHKRHNAIKLLISMLPVANRDTLWALLRFLATVSQHATDTTDEKGEVIPGNKMDAHNLATLFGPNILHRTKAATDKELMSESAERVEQSKEIIEVVKYMIDNNHECFEISGNLRDDILRLLIESNQDTADRILKGLANQNQIEADPESMCSVFDDAMNGPILYHSMNSDADLLSYARKTSSTSHRPLRVTKSADNSLDHPASKARSSHLSESQALSPSSKDNQTLVPSSPVGPGTPRFDLGQNFPIGSRVPILKVSHDTTNTEVVLRGRLDVANMERPYSEGYNQSLSIPRPVYYRENSGSSISSGLSSSLNSHGGSDNSQTGQWVLPTPPTSRGTSPKPYFKYNLSSSTLIPSSSSKSVNYTSLQNDDENNPPVGSSEWEQERWRHWEKIAAEKKSLEAEQETLV